jgi:hypothetical protein
MVKQEGKRWVGKSAATIVMPSGPDGELEEITDPYEDYEIWRTTSFLPVVTRYSLCAYSFSIFEDCLRCCAEAMRSGVHCSNHGAANLDSHKDCLRNCGKVSGAWVQSCEWTLITKVAILRHAIVHSNGRLSLKSPRYGKSKAAIEELQTSALDNQTGESVIRLADQTQIILEAGSVGWVCDQASGILSSLKRCL